MKNMYRLLFCLSLCVLLGCMNNKTVSYSYEFGDSSIGQILDGMVWESRPASEIEAAVNAHVNSACPLSELSCIEAQGFMCGQDGVGACVFSGDVTQLPLDDDFPVSRVTTYRLDLSVSQARATTRLRTSVSNQSDVIIRDNLRTGPARGFLDNGAVAWGLGTNLLGDNSTELAWRVDLDGSNALALNCPEGSIECVEDLGFECAGNSILSCQASRYLSAEPRIEGSFGTVVRIVDFRVAGFDPHVVEVRRRVLRGLSVDQLREEYSGYE
jgi:hypothetical protein